MRPPAVGLGVGFLLASVLAGGCSKDADVRTAPSGGRCDGCNVVLISLDTLRADHLGAYGYRKPTSPCIDRFARESIRFELSFSQSTWTLPSHMSILTSLYPGQHGMVSRNRRLPRAIGMLTEILRERGYATAAFTGGGLMAAEFGFDRGFDVYKQSYRDQERTPGKGRRLREMLPELRAWLDDTARSHEPFFLLVHTYDVHGPYIANSYLPELEDGTYDGKLRAIDGSKSFFESELFETHRPVMASDRPNLNDFYGQVIAKGRIELTPADRAHVVALYDGEIRQVDDHFCTLWNELEGAGLMERTIVVLTSDHGETLFERDDLGHGGRPYEDLIRVPLIVHVPGHAPAASSKLVQGIDVAPTILHALGVEPPKSFTGRSLLPLDAPGNELVAAESGDDGVGAALRDARYKLIVYPDSTVLFDLAADPGELRDVSGDNPQIVAKLKSALWDALDRVELDARTRENLGALGYVD